MTLKRTTSDNPDFEKLVVQLDAYLRVLDGDDHEFYAQFNKSSALKNALIAYENETPIGIGAYKEFENAAEMKRMYVLPEHRGKGIATLILTELETWAKEEGYAVSLLETGHLQTDAVALYTKMGYQRIDNFGQYIGVENSVCMKKILK
ncbi:MAG: GNAT family N-acetyltransferase [Candidatus Doudnabacteria bacterium]|nr:GNAT family N-acetyltransferase [Candidatus Doudnabacteria bacterium]